MIRSWLAGLALYALLDLGWVGWLAHGFYSSQVGHLMAEKARFGPILLFYPLYSLGVYYFAARLAADWKAALINGAALGLLVYGTYNLTNLALLKGWTVRVATVDVLWGIFATAMVALAARQAA